MIDDYILVFEDDGLGIVSYLVPVLVASAAIVYYFLVLKNRVEESAA